MRGRAVRGEVPTSDKQPGLAFDPSAPFAGQTFAPGVHFELSESDEQILTAGEAGVEDASKFAAKQIRETLTLRLNELRAEQPTHFLDRTPENAHMAICTCGASLYHAGGPDPYVELLAHQTTMKTIAAQRVSTLYWSAPRTWS
jgi:hypothetical protein